MKRELKKNPDILKYDLAAVADVLNKQIRHVSFNKDGTVSHLVDEYGSFFANLELWFELKKEISDGDKN